MRRLLTPTFALALLAAPALPASAAPAGAASTASAADADTIRSNFVRFHTAADADRNHPLVRAAVAKLGSDAAGALSSLQSDGHWADVTYSGSPDAGWNMEPHYRRVLLLARAYRTPGQPLHNRADVLKAVESALAYGGRTVYPGAPTPGNWWNWEVALPYSMLGPTLLLMDGHLPAAAFNRQRDSLAYYVGLNLRGAEYGGQNRVSKGMTRLYLGALKRDPALLAQAREDVSAVCRVTTSDGIQPDYSFQQHGALLMTGSYGAEFGEAAGQYFLFTEGTAYAAPAEVVNTYANFVAEGLRWSLYHNYFDFHSVGRGVTRQNQNGRLGLMSLLLTSAFQNPRREACVVAAKRMLQTFTESQSVGYAGLSAKALSDPAPATALLGTRTYPRSDFVVHRARTFFLSLKMLSSRTMAAEEVNKEGKKSWHVSDGFTYLVRVGTEYLSGNVLPALDWTRLPGTTVERRERGREEGYGRGTRTFVGAAAAGLTGVAAMDFKANASPLEARKSWFFFENEVVFLGDNIRCTSGNPVETIINQWPLDNPNAPVTVKNGPINVPMNGAVEVSRASWLHADGLGYYFPTEDPVVVARETRSGKWNEIGASGGSTVSKTFLSIRRDHGANPSGARYAYAIVPNATPASMAAYAAAPPITVLSDRGAAHAVRHNPSGAMGVVFWQAGAVGDIRANRPCVVAYRKVGEGIIVAVSDPAQTGQPIEVVFAGTPPPFRLDAGVTSKTSGERTVLTVRAADGTNAVARFGPPKAFAIDEEVGFSGPAGPVDVTVVRPAQGQNAVLHLNLDAPAGIQIRIVNRMGEVVLDITRDFPAGPAVIEWDGRSADGNRVASGIYQVFLSGGGHQSRRKVAVVK